MSATMRADLSARLDVLERARGHLVDATLALALTLQAEARELGDEELAGRCVLVEADMRGRKGELADSARLVWDVHQWADAHANLRLLARSHRLLSRTFANLGDMATGLEHALLALESLDQDASTVLRMQLVSNLADALGNVGAFEEARERYAEAGRTLRARTEWDELLHVLNNHAYTEYEADHIPEAERLAEQMIEVSLSHGVALNPAMLDTVAAVRIATGHYAAAEESALAAVEYLRAGRYHQVELLAQHLVTLAQARRLRGDLPLAEQTVTRALDACTTHELRGVRARALLEAATIAAAQQDFRRAYELHVAFHEQGKANTSASREAAVRTRQAIFETDEARAAAERFREQAMHDSLTGLRNRRFFDERMAALLGGEGSGTLALALLDLDHFKNVNDTYSHEVGDAVLAVTARLIEGCVPDSAGGDRDSQPFAARIGGEEFALVLPAMPLVQAAGVAEAVRRRVREHDWTALLGDGIQTISIGLACASVGESVTAVLRRADTSLYDAKARGRDQVAWDEAARTSGDAVLERRLYR